MLKFRRSLPGPNVTVPVVVVLALVGGVFGLVPVKSQAPRLEAASVAAPIAEDDPWSSVWDEANSRHGA